MSSFKLKGPEDLEKLAEEARKELVIREGAEFTVKVFIGPLNNRETYRKVAKAFVDETKRANVRARVIIAEGEAASGLDPLVEIDTPRDGVVLYANITPDKVPILVREHLVRGNIVSEWIISQKRSQHVLFSWH